LEPRARPALPLPAPLGKTEEEKAAPEPVEKQTAEQALFEPKSSADVGVPTPAAEPEEDMDQALFEALKEKKKKTKSDGKAMRRPAAAPKTKPSTALKAEKLASTQAAAAKPAAKPGTKPKAKANAKGRAVNTAELRGYKVLFEEGRHSTCNAFASRHYNRAGKHAEMQGCSAARVLAAKKAAYREATKVWQKHAS
jgi:hypothetical protein